jgi:hypothetical protein
MGATAQTAFGGRNKLKIVRQADVLEMLRDDGEE